MVELVCKIAALFERSGGARCPDEAAARTGVSALAHALQCAQLAEWAHADHSLVAAALLHDLGQMLDGAGDELRQDEPHEQRALSLLASGGFGPAVLEPIRLHVQAKRFLVGSDARYAETLSAASLHSLGRQGGRMNAEERLLFLTRPYASEALQLRRWDDLAKRPGMRTPPLAHYLQLLEGVLRESPRSARLQAA